MLEDLKNSVCDANLELGKTRCSYLYMGEMLVGYPVMENTW